MGLNPFARRAPSAADVLRAIEATPEIRDAVVEAYSSPYDPDANLNANQGGSSYFRGLMQSTRDVPEYDHKRAMRLAYNLADINPIARRIANIYKSFVVGSGVTFTVNRVLADGAMSDAEVQASTERAASLQTWLDRFWADNELRVRLPDRVKALSITGEQCWSVAVDTAGQVRLGYIDPETIEAVIPDPLNHEADVAVVLNIKDSTGQPLVLKVVRDELDPASAAYGRRMAAAEGETYTLPVGVAGSTVTGVYAGSCFNWRINAPPNARRGRPDILAAIDYIDAYDQILMNDVDRTDLQKRFAWDVTLAGADAQAVKARAKELAAPPKPGTAIVHNDSETWQAITPDLRMQDAQAGADLLLSYISTGTDMPKLWLNGTMDTNRATASELPEPTYMALEERQTFVQYMLGQVFGFVLDQAELAGQIERRDGLRPEPWPVVVTMPELVRKDLNPAASALGAVVTAVATAKEAQLVDAVVAQQAVVTALGNFGLEVDLAEMQKRIAMEAPADAAPYPDVPTDGLAASVEYELSDGSRRLAEATAQREHADRMLDTIGRLAEALGQRTPTVRG